MGLVMFDYDGVIVDSLDFFISDFASACRENNFLEINTREDVIKLFEGNVYATMKEKGLSPGVIDSILSAYGAKANLHIDEAKVFDGMSTALHSIAEQNRVFIITSNISYIPLQVLQKNNISCIEDVIGAEKEKSKIKKIKGLMDKFPQLPAYYVGDTIGDIVEGKKAGAQTIGVAWGWHGAARLLESTPDYIVYSPEELADLLCSK